MSTDKQVTHVLMIVDMSGSMSTLAQDVRGGFNDYIKKLREDEDNKYRITVAFFDHEYMPLCSTVSPKKVPLLTEQLYYPRGNTALLDAVGRTLNAFDSTKLGTNDRVILFVQTDGKENFSHEFDKPTIANMIKTREDTGKWSCIYLGATLEAFSQAGDLGFRGSTLTKNTKFGTRSAYRAMANNTVAYAAGADSDQIKRSIQQEVTESES